jgi:hypothetical protein
MDEILQKKKLSNIIEKEKEKEKDNNNNNIIVEDNNILQIGNNKTNNKIHYNVLKDDIRKTSNYKRRYKK